MGYFDNFGFVAKKQCMGADLQAFAELNQILGFDLKIESLETEWGTKLEFQGATVEFRFENGMCAADFSLPPSRNEELISEVLGSIDFGGIFLAQMRNVVGRLNFAQSAVMT